MARNGTLTVRIVGDSKPLEKTLDGMGGKLKTFGKGAALAGGAAAAGLLVVGQEVLNTGAKLETWRLKTKTVFEGSAKDVRKWADENNEAFGVTDDELAGLAASFGDLLKPMGFTAKQASDMSMDVVGLSGALSEWSGGQRSAAEVSQILAKAMLGERDGLKELGISITEADVQARLLKNGQQELTGAALEQAKATATQQLIFEKSTDAQKAYAAGGNEALRAQNELKAGIGELREQMADKLLPIAVQVVQWAADMLPKALAGAEVAVGFLQRKWEEIEPTIRTVLEVSQKVIEGFVAAVTWLWDNFGRKIADTIYTYFEVMKGLIGAALQIIMGIWETFAGLFSGDWSRMWDGIKQVLDGAWDYIKTATSGALDILKTWFKDLPGQIVALIKLGLSALQGVGEWIVRRILDGVIQLAEATNGIAGWFRGLPARVGEWVLEQAAKLLDIGKTIVAKIVEGIKSSAGSIAGAIGSAIPGGGIVKDIVGAFGDGPGKPTGGGSTLRRVQSVLGAGTYVTSTYRSPQYNARVGGSPTSYHMDRGNPAVDIGGSTAALDALYARLKSMGGWRELLWRTAGHYDHIHVAHQGGTVSSSWPTMPGLRSDERPAILQVGEEVVPRDGGRVAGLLSQLVDVSRQIAAHTAPGDPAVARAMAAARYGS